MSTNADNSYDEVPYESSPYANTHPVHLATIGQIFGMTPVKADKARILELGCASGGNIIPLALQYPKAEIVGVDLSQVQIDIANKAVKELSLKNITFHTKSITDIKDELGKFDYIIVHGILSWVPELVQDKIFELCNKLLTKQGIAYISYNTLPGWNMIKSIRDMMLYHSSSFPKVQDKITQSRLLLKFITESLEGQNTPYAEVLKNETALLAKQPDYYLRHDHLEDNNHPFYFKDIVQKATANKLQYLGDASLPSMYIGNLPKEAAEKLGEVSDITRSEQYMDFINNRRFRMTLLCKQDVKLNRNLSTDTIRTLALSMQAVPQDKLAKNDLTNNKQVVFTLGTNKATISTTSPILKTSFSILTEMGNGYITFTDLIKEINIRLAKAKIENDVGKVEALMAIELSKLMLTGHLSVKNAIVPPYATKASVKPKALPLVQYQCSTMPIMWATNARHERIPLNIFDKYALRYCDGNNNHEQIIDKLFEHVKNNELTITVKDKKTTDKKEVLPQLQSALNQSIENWVKSALLSA